MCCQSLAAKPYLRPHIIKNLEIYFPRPSYRGAVFILPITSSIVPARPISPLCIAISSPLVACDPGKISVPIFQVFPDEAYRE